LKTRKTENVRQVNFDELIADNVVVSEKPAEIDTAWDLRQNDLLIMATANNGKRRDALGGGNHGAVRQFEAIWLDEFRLIARCI